MSKLFYEERISFAVLLYIILTRCSLYYRRAVNSEMVSEKIPEIKKNFTLQVDREVSEKSQK